MKCAPIGRSFTRPSSGSSLATGIASTLGSEDTPDSPSSKQTRALFMLGRLRVNLSPHVIMSNVALTSAPNRGCHGPIEDLPLGTSSMHATVLSGASFCSTISSRRSSSLVFSFLAGFCGFCFFFQLFGSHCSGWAIGSSGLTFVPPTRN